jgi:hypothetical protein
MGSRCWQIEARAECPYLRGSIAETRIASPNEGRLLGTVTGVLNGASTVFTTGTPPNVTSFDTFVTTQGDMLTATGRPTRTPIPGAPPGEFTVHVDLTITGGSGKYAGATGWMTFDGQSHNALAVSAWQPPISFIEVASAVQILKPTETRCSRHK